MEDIKQDQDLKYEVAHQDEAAPEIAGLSKGEYLQAQYDALAVGRSPWAVIKENPKVIAVCMAIQCHGIILGLEYVLLGALVGVQAFCKTMGSYDAATDSYAVQAWKLSLWAGLFGLMQFGGQLVAGAVADRFGRVITLYMVILLTYIGVTLEIVSSNYKIYTGAKIIMGLSTGALQVGVPTYIAEIAPRELRGILVGMFAFDLSLGALIGSLVTYAGNQAYGGDVLDNRGWKVPLYVGLAAPTVLLVFQIFLLRESPYWLTLKNKTEQARKSLRFMHPNRTDAEIDEEVNVLVFTIAKEKEEAASTKDASYWECLRGVNLRRTFVAAFPSCAQQLCGNQLVQSYSTYFFTLAKISNSLKASVVVTCLGLAGAIASFFVIERKLIGRFWLVFVGIVMVTISMLGIGIVDSASGGVIGKSGGYALVFFVALYNLAVSFGPGVAGWAYAGEAGSVRLRAKTTTFAPGSNAIVGTFWNVVLPYELVAIGPKTGYMFFGIGVICSVAIWFFIPDLSGRSYAQMDELFERRVPARKFKDFECTGDYGRDQVQA